MKPYKSIYNESQNRFRFNEQEFDFVEASIEDVDRIVDISHLRWSKSSKILMTFEEAVNSTPMGYRLPTIQELYTASREGLKGFAQGYHWSSSLLSSDKEIGWVMDFKYNFGDVSRSSITSPYVKSYVIYVKGNLSR